MTFKDINNGITIEIPTYTDKISIPAQNNRVDKSSRLKKSLVFNEQVTNPD